MECSSVYKQMVSVPYEAALVLGFSHGAVRGLRGGTVSIVAAERKCASDKGMVRLVRSKPHLKFYSFQSPSEKKYNLANLYIGAFWKLTMGLIGLPVLCNLINDLICGGFGFSILVCHFLSLGISILQLLITYLII
jgi:hypothetical protein